MDNILRNNGVRMTISDVAKALNQQYETTRKLLKSLENKGVIAVAQVGSIEKPDIKIKSIIANPYIFVRGKCQKRSGRVRQIKNRSVVPQFTFKCNEVHPFRGQDRIAYRTIIRQE